MLGILERSVSRSNFLLFRFTAIGVLAASLALAACGRKGPLDLPPSAAQQQRAEGQSGAGDTSAQGIDKPIVRSAVPIEYDAGGRPLAPRGQKKKLPGDFLID